MSTKSPIIRDPNHPDFPHGEPKGRSRGCKCTPCTEARTKQNKRRAYLRGKGVPGRRATTAQFARAVAHIDRLREGGAAYAAIARAAGVSHSSLSRASRNGYMAPQVAQAVLKVTPEQVGSALLMVPADESIFFTRTMQALGYPVLWQRKQTGSYAASRFLYGDTTKTRHVEVGVARAIRELAERVGDTPADPSMGFTKQAIAHAKAMARRAGYYPPIHYNDDRTLDYRSIPDHPWAKVDEQAHRKIALARAYVFNDANLSRVEIAKSVGEDTRAVDRFVDRFHLQLSVPDRGVRIAELREQIHRFDAEDMDPVRFAIDAGLLSPDQLYSDHPAVAQWLTDHPEWVRPGLAKIREINAARGAASREVAA